MSDLSMADPNRLATLGVDTHLETHVAAALDGRGRLLDTLSLPTTNAGYQVLLQWAAAFGTMHRVGVEGTGSYGPGLVRWLRAQGIVVLEVDRPALTPQPWQVRPVRHEAAARAVQSDRASGSPGRAPGRSRPFVPCASRVAAP